LASNQRVADVIQEKGKVCFTVDEFDFIKMKKMTKQELKNLYRVKKKFVGTLVK